jgi:hypothetical protein
MDNDSKEYGYALDIGYLTLCDGCNVPTAAFRFPVRWLRNRNVLLALFDTKKICCEICWMDYLSRVRIIENPKRSQHIKTPGE